MDIRKIRKIIDLMNEKGIGEIEISEGEESVRISQFVNNQSQTNHQLITNVASSSPPPLTTIPTIEKEANEAQHAIHSPMVGTFYAAPNPEEESFVKIGQTVVEGDVLCIVEAMKMFNQIEADRAGKIISCLAENGQPVEYGQKLFIIE